MHEHSGKSDTAPLKRQDVLSWLPEAEGAPLVGEKITPFLHKCAERWVALHGRFSTAKLWRQSRRSRRGPGQARTYGLGPARSTQLMLA